MASSASPPGLANKFLSSDTSATAMAKFSLDLRDLEEAAVLEALGRVPETQWPVTEALTLELSTDSEVTFRIGKAAKPQIGTTTKTPPNRYSSIGYLRGQTHMIGHVTVVSIFLQSHNVFCMARSHDQVTCQQCHVM